MYKVTHGSFVVAIESGTENLNISKRKITLVRHNYGEKKYSLPGGKINQYEDPETTALRELAEETGLSITTKCVPVGTFMSRKNPGTLTFLFSAVYANNPKITRIEEISEIKIVSIEEAFKYDMYPGQKILLASYVVNDDYGHIIDWMSEPEDERFKKFI